MSGEACSPSKKILYTRLRYYKGAVSQIMVCTSVKIILKNMRNRDG